MLKGWGVHSNTLLFHQVSIYVFHSKSSQFGVMEAVM